MNVLRKTKQCYHVNAFFSFLFLRYLLFLLPFFSLLRTFRTGETVWTWTCRMPGPKESPEVASWSRFSTMAWKKIILISTRITWVLWTAHCDLFYISRFLLSQKHERNKKGDSRSLFFSFLFSFINYYLRNIRSRISIIKRSLLYD